MNAKLITSNDFLAVAKEHEYFIWHFFNNNASKDLEIYSYFQSFRDLHALKEIVDLLRFPFFESDITKEYDFLINLEDGIAKKIWAPRNPFKPVILGFKRTKLLASTYDTCYCKDGFIELIAKINPEFLLNVD